MDFDYFKMRAFFQQQDGQQEVSFKLNDLASSWYCSPKQTKRRLLQYQKDGKLNYQPGLGRGNMSKLIFSNSFQEEITHITTQAIHNRQLEEVLSLLQLDIPKQWFDPLLSEIKQLFNTVPAANKHRVLRYIIRRPITSLDPIKTALSRESFLIKQLGDTLVRYDEKKYLLTPNLAHHWYHSEDHCQWTFFLRKSVYFHHGRTLTSEDVRYTLERATASESVVGWQLRNIQNVWCPDEETITIQLSEGDPFFGRYLAMGNLAILPFDVPFDETQWVSTGPFRMKELTENKLVLEAFDQYFAERALMDRIEFWHMRKDHWPATVLLGDEMQTNQQHYVEYRKENVGVEFYIFNFNKPSIVHHPAFREAFCQLIQVEKMLHEVENRANDGRPAFSFFPDKEAPVIRTPQAIPALLKKAHYQGEQLVVGMFEHHPAIEQVQWVQSRAQAYGIHLDIKLFSLQESFYTAIFEDTVDILLIGDMPPADIETGFLDFCSNPALFCQRFFSDKMKKTLAKRFAAMKLLPSSTQRLKEMYAIDDWLIENNYLVYTLFPTKVEWVHAIIDSPHNDFFSYLDLRNAWISAAGAE